MLEKKVTTFELCTGQLYTGFKSVQVFSQSYCIMKGRIGPLGAVCLQKLKFFILINA